MVHSRAIQSFFANERTLIQWITIGSLFMFVAGLVYAAGYSMGPHYGQPFMYFGSGLIACALFIVLYGCFIYYRRIYLMMSKWHDDSFPRLNLPNLLP